MHFGYPYCHQGDTPDPEFGRGRACSEFAAPVVNPGAHVAARGMRFYTGCQFPAEYRHSIFIAEHGSWNRSKKNRLSHPARRGLGRQSGDARGLRRRLAAGRIGVGAVDIEVMRDGPLLVSDDHAGAIYRISYRGK